MADSQTITMRQRVRDTLVLPSTAQGYLQFDAVISEEHGQKLTVTENPTELGVNISDHCYVDEATLTIVGSVADVAMPNAAAGYASEIGRSNSAYLANFAALENLLATANQLATSSTSSRP